MSTQPTEVRFGRLDRRGLLLGLSAAQLALIGVALLTVVAAGMSAGPPAIAMAAPLWVCTLSVALVPVGGRPLIEALPILVPWAVRRMLRRAAVTTPMRGAPVRIPGVPGRLRLLDDRGTGVGTIQLAGRRTGQPPFVVVARVRGRGFLLEDAAAQDRQVDGWGKLLGSLSQLPHVTGVQVVHRTVAHPGAEVHRWWTAEPRGSAAWASRIVEDLSLDQANASTLDTLLALSVQPRRGLTVASLTGSIAESIDGANIELVEWLTHDQVAQALTAPFEPAAPALGRRAHAGPMGVSEAWSHARGDAAVHATFWIGEWPRSATHPGFLRSILLAPGAVRTFSLTAEPLPTGKALREIRRARAEQVADAATRTRIGQIEDEATRAAAAELTRREEDLVAGHGDLRFVGLVSVTAATVDELEDSCAALQSSAGQAGCELRRLVGQQVQAFAAAALPLARVLA